MSSTRAASQRQLGFSLIEILATIALLGIISTIAATNFKALWPGLRARGAALQIAGDMNQARLASVKEGRSYFFVPVSATSYQITYQTGSTTTVKKTVNVAADYPQVKFGATGIAAGPYGGAIGGAYPGANIVFNSSGTITNAANLYVEPTTSPTGAQHAVTVTPAGRIRVWKYNGTAWN